MDMTLKTNKTNKISRFQTQHFIEFKNSVHPHFQPSLWHETLYMDIQVCVSVAYRLEQHRGTECVCHNDGWTNSS